MLPFLALSLFSTATTAEAGDPPQAPPQADLRVEAVGDPELAIPGQLLLYTVNVTNDGPTHAPSTDLTLVLSGGMTFVASSGCVMDPNAFPQCHLQTVDAGASKQATFQVLVDQAASGSLTMVASAESSHTDPDPADNMVTVRTPVSTEIVVGRGTSPAIASDATASQRFSVVWEDAADTASPEGGSGGVVARVFDVTGMPVGIEMRLDASGTTHLSPDVARQGGGDFVAVWQSEDADGSGVFARLFENTGMPVGIEIRLNQVTDREQSLPAVAGTGDGFVVTWSDEQSPGSFVRALRRFSATGMPVGIEIRFSASDISAKPPAAAVSSDRILVTWEDAADRIAAQLFDLAGMPVGIEFHIAGSGLNAQPSAAAHPDGGFVIVWQDESGLDSDGDGIFGRRFDDNGMPVGIEFQLNSAVTGNQQQPSIAAAPDGTFAVTWQGPDADGSGIYARRLDADGMPVGIEQRFSLSTGGDQTGGKPAFVDQDGTFYVAWQSQDEDSEVLISPPSLLFANGFESGDLTAWSGSSF